MVKHIILWKLKDQYSKEQMQDIKLGVKQNLEGLKGKIPGLIDIKVVTEGLAGSNADLMLDASFENEEALNRYAVHPAHVGAADEYVRPFTAERNCMDFEV